MSERRSIEELIERSSLGSAEAKAARASVPPGVGTAIALAARYLGERDHARDIAAALEQQLAEVRLLADKYWREADAICPEGQYDKGDKAWRVADARRRVSGDLRRVLDGTA